MNYHNNAKERVRKYASRKRTFQNIRFAKIYYGVFSNCLFTGIKPGGFTSTAKKLILAEKLKLVSFKILQNLKLITGHVPKLRRHKLKFGQQEFCAVTLLINALVMLSWLRFVQHMLHYHNTKNLCVHESIRRNKICIDILSVHNLNHNWKHGSWEPAREA